MPALTRGYLRAMLAGEAPPRNEEEFMITVMHSIKKHEQRCVAWAETLLEALVAWAEKHPWAAAVCAIMFFLVIIFITWAAWYGILKMAGYATGYNLRPAGTAALVVAVHIGRA